ncbi:hypothetical protein Ahy_A02g007898 [Arachis hypogaea]|uniref:Uncharacterized protein n=1 Tax=Arachis hypogaea TaxID=3818 RepID=A0A445EDP0_ARAHY|nr:hypothetical protein Ahy_A02g007898 [Arachis hypogaea]
MLNNKRRGKENYKAIIYRVGNNLNGWKSKCLSMAGRITLAQAVISPSVNFDMQHEKVQKMIEAKSSDSNLWKDLAKLWGTFQNLSVTFVGDRWVEKIDDTLKNFAQLNLDLNGLVWEWANDNEGWNKEKLKLYLPNDITVRVFAQPPPNNNTGKDRQGWGLSEDGDYSVARTYRALSNWPPPSTTNWRKLWQWKGPQKVKTILWRMMHNRLLTNQRRSR